MKHSAWLLVLATGCGTIVVDGITVREASYRQAHEVVLGLAEKDLSCPRAELTATVKGVHPAADVDHFEVTGCGQTASYTGIADSWRRAEPNETAEP